MRFAKARCNARNALALPVDSSWFFLLGQPVGVSLRFTFGYRLGVCGLDLFFSALTAQHAFEFNDPNEFFGSPTGPAAHRPLHPFGSQSLFDLPRPRPNQIRHWQAL
jgi:hypothetical protein